MTAPRRSWLALAAALVPWAGILAAGDDPTPPGPQDDVSAQIIAEERDVEWRAMGLGRLRLSFPQRVSGALGMLFARQPVSYDCTTVCEFKGLLVQAEPGYSGGQLALGYADVMGESGSHEHVLSRIYLAWGVKAALLRTWHNADLRPADQTLVGFEGDFTVVQVHFSLGLFQAVHPEDAADPWVVTGGMGWGF